MTYSRLKVDIYRHEYSQWLYFVCLISGKAVDGGNAASDDDDDDNDDDGDDVMMMMKIMMMMMKKKNVMRMMRIFLNAVANDVHMYNEYVRFILSWHWIGLPSGSNI